MYIKIMFSILPLTSCIGVVTTGSQFYNDLWL